MNEVTTYDYDAVPVDVAEQAKAAAERIRVRMKRTAEDIVAVGLDLQAIKDELPHGAFLPWIQAEFGMSQPTAFRFMTVASTYSGKLFKLNNLGPTALYELAAPSTPDTVREEVERRAQEGGDTSVAEIKRLKREAAAAVERAQRAEDEAEAQRDKAETLIDGQRALIANAERKVREEVQAEAEQLADQALAKRQDAMRKARKEEEAARKSLERINESVEKVRSSAEEHKAYLKNLRNKEVEAKNIRETLTEVVRTLSLAVGDILDLEHQHGPEVLDKAENASRVCRQFADVLDVLGSGDADGEAPQLKLVGSSED